MAQSPEDDRKRIKEKAFRYLAGRAHSVKELQDKLAQKGFSGALIADVLNEFIEKKFLNDEEFALSFARTRMVKKPMGQRLLRQELLRKGLSKGLIDKAIRDVYSAKSEAEFAREVAEKRLVRYKDLETRKKKKRLNDFLLRRGFDWEIAREAAAATIEQSDIIGF
ncbi:MAG: regulatory protein RecX [bacterium]